MNEKLIINTNLLRKESEFRPKKCIIEKSIAISHAEFDELKRHPLRDNDFYIITGTCKPAEPRTMQNRFKAILKVCGIRNVNFHLLRHTYATVCIENGFDPKTLSELLGHADASITLNRYVHSSMLMKKNYVSRSKLTA